MKIIVGLGNPGSQYELTRHNIGFRVIDSLVARITDLEFHKQRKYSAVSGKFISDEVILLKPLTFMNLSGMAIKKAVEKWPTDIGNLLVISDDLNLPLGKIRARAQGSSGGQKGIQSIGEYLETFTFSRIRLGIGQPENPNERADYVLSNFDPSEDEIVNDMIRRATDACCVWIENDIVSVMNLFN